MKKTQAELEAEKKARKTAIELAEKAYSDFEVKEPTDLQKSFDLLKAVLELKGADEVKNFDEKIAAIEAASLEAKEAKETEIKTISERLEATISALDIVQARVKTDGRKSTGSVPATFADNLKKSLEDATDSIAKFNRKESKGFAIDIKAVGDMSTANVTGGSRYGQLEQTGIIMNPNRKVHIMDILPGGNVGPGNTYTYMRENGNGEGAIAPVAEGAAKSQFDLDLVEATVNIETIAGYMRVTRKAMSNIPGFISFLQARLPEKFKKVLDSQILYGDGNTPNLKGLLTAGNFVASTAVLNTFLAEKITNDIAILEDTYERNATAVLLRPIDIATFYTNKSSGSGEYDLPENVVFMNGQLFISGVPVYASTAVTAPDYVVGDFQMGAQLLTQEGMRIEFFEQDADNVTKNKVTVRIEGNYALPVYGPDYFIKGTTARA